MATRLFDDDNVWTHRGLHANARLRAVIDRAIREEVGAGMDLRDLGYLGHSCVQDVCTTIALEQRFDAGKKPEDV